jgi:hypothetical protein
VTGLDDGNVFERKPWFSRRLDVSPGRLVIAARGPNRVGARLARSRGTIDVSRAADLQAQLRLAVGPGGGERAIVPVFFVATANLRAPAQLILAISLLPGRYAPL